jgi:DNA polymerase-3 subunit beta
MKFSIVRSTFFEALQKVQNVVPAKSTLQILSNALIQAEDGQLCITTTDLDISVRCYIDCEIDQPGSVTLPIRRLTSIIRELDDGIIMVEIDDNDVASLQSGSSFFKIYGLPIHDFPPIPEAEGKYCFNIDQGVFREMLRKSSYAASQDETRIILNGVLLSFKDSKLTTVATDGRRLALVEQEVEFPAEAECEVVLPTKAVSELMRILGSDGELKIYVQNNQIIFEMSDSVMSSKVIDGVYPNYRQVIPSGCDEKVVVERELLLYAIKRVALMTSDTSDTTRLTFSANQLTITTNTQDVGEGRDTVPIKYAGKEISIVFKPEYVMDPLKNIDDDEVYFELNDGFSPALLKCTLPFLYVLMPLRVN